MREQCLPNIDWNTDFRHRAGEVATEIVQSPAWEVQSLARGFERALKRDWLHWEVLAQSRSERDHVLEIVLHHRRGENNYVALHPGRIERLNLIEALAREDQAANYTVEFGVVRRGPDGTQLCVREKSITRVFL
jgi:hypothetical protein